MIIILFFGINFFFATLYYLNIDQILNAQKGSFHDAFFFSVQTLATIGYGTMSPHGFLVNSLVTVESMLGFAYYGIVTGVMFAKFSSPNARILFSNIAVIRDYDGVPHFMLRLANERANGIVDAAAKLTLMRNEPFDRMHNMRRLYDLKLVRSEIPFLRLTWVLMHKIDETSPLYGMDLAALEKCEAEIIVSITGLDETFAQTVHARFSYISDEIIFNKAFVDIINRRDDYVLEIDYSKIHELEDF